MDTFDDAFEERLKVSQMITPTLLNKGERLRETLLSPLPVAEGLAPRLDSTTDKGGGEGLETTIIRVFLFFL